MANIMIEQSHELTHEDAHDRLKRLGDYLAKKYKMNVIWNEEHAHVTGKVMMVNVDATVSLIPGAPGRVKLFGKDPGALFRKTVEEFLLSSIKRYLDPKITAVQLPSIS